MRKILAAILVLAAFAVLWFGLRKGNDRSTSIVVRCPAAYGKIVRPVAERYQQEFGDTVEIHETGWIAEDDLVFGLASQLAASKAAGEVREMIPVAKDGSDILSIGVLDGCEHPPAALRFARYLAAPGKGSDILEASGVEPIPGDTWAVKPDLILYSGGVNRPAVEKLLNEFSEREGISMTTVFNGCGILCAAMQTMTDTKNPRFPDAYYACDVCFVPPVADHFSEVVLLTETDIGIAVPTGNPKQVKSLADLARPGLKVGLCNQKQSTLGYMTGGILRSSGLETSIRKNVAVEVPTADFLITQLRSGALDAAIVYRVNADAQKDKVDFFKINHEGAHAVQPFSVRNDSDKSQLAQRLQDWFVGHREAFEETGFVWRGDENPLKSSEIKIPSWLKQD